MHLARVYLHVTDLDWGCRADRVGEHHVVAEERVVVILNKLMQSREALIGDVKVAILVCNNLFGMRRHVVYLATRALKCLTPADTRNEMLKSPATFVLSRTR